MIVRADFKVFISYYY